MNSIDLKVTKSTMSISNIYTLNQGEYNVDKCVFDFTSDYDDLIKKAIFIYNDEEPIEMVIFEDECNIPYELLQSATEFTLKVYAYEVQNEELIQRYSPTPLKIFLREGSYQGSNEVITPSQFEQYEAKLNEGLEQVDSKLEEVDQALQTMETATEETNRLNIDVSDKVNKDVTITLTKKDNTTKSVVISDGDDFQYNWNGTRLGVKTDKEESYSYVDLQGQQGPMGPQGEAFQIKKTYTTTQEMIADYDNMEVNDYVMISGSVEQQDNATLWVKTETEDPTYKWVYLADFSGASGIQGPTGATPNIQIGNVTQGDTPNVTRRGTDENPILDFTLVKGDKGNTGNTGPTGNGISSVEKISTSGLVDTYRQTFTNGEHFDYDVTNGADGNVTDVQVEGTSVVDNGVANITGLATQEELDRYKTIYNALPKVTGTGESITLNDTAESVMKNKLYPQMEQYSTTGKQLFDISKVITAGTSVINNGNNTLTINTSSSSSAMSALQPNTLADYCPNLQVGDIVYLNATSTGTDKKIYLSTSAFSWAFGTSRTITQDDLDSKVFWYASGNSTNATISNIIISTTNDTTWEEYSGGSPSPSPSYPQPIHTISGDNTILVCNTNYLDNYAIVKGRLDNGIVGYADGTTILSVTEDSVSFTTNTSYRGIVTGYIPIKSSTNILISYENATNTIGTQVSYYDDDKQFISSSNGSSMTNGRKFSNNVVNSKYIRIWILLDSAGSATITRPQINFVDTTTPTTYEPYQSQSKPLNLGDLEYNAIGDYKDEFVKVDGEWFLRKNIGKVVLDGSENGWNGSSYGNGFRAYNSSIFSNAKTYSLNGGYLGYSNYFYKDIKVFNAETADVGMYGQYKGTTETYFMTSETSMTNFKTWLGTHNTEVYYVLATPTTISLPTTLQNQIEDLYNTTMSYKGQTNISQVNNDLAFVVESSALKDMSENSL